MSGSAPLRCETLTAGAALEALRPEWDALATRVEAATAYDVGSIALAIADVIRPRGEPAVLTVRTPSGALAAVVPLRHDPGPRWLSAGHVTSLLGWHGSVCAPLMDPAIPGVARACAEWIRTVGTTHPVVIRHVSGASLLLPEFPEAERAPQGAWSWVEHDDATDHTLHGSSETRRLIRQQIRGGRVQVCTDEPPDAIPAVVRQFGALHTARWRDVPDAAEFAAPDTCERLGQHLRALRGDDRCRVGTLRSDGVIGAVVLTFRHGQRDYAWRAAYDPALRRISPGRLLMGQMVAAAFAEGRDRFVLGRGAEEYKRDWPIHSEPLWRIAPPSGRWHRLAARLARRSIPAGRWHPTPADGSR